MKPDLLKKGDIIGIVCPSHVADPLRHQKSTAMLNLLGYSVKMGENVYKNTHGYLASDEERAEDFNAMVADKDVKMVLFGGGEGGGDLLPLLDFDLIKQNPKNYCSFSDGTTILNAIHAMTGLTVHYGPAPGIFNDLRHFDYLHFAAHFIHGGAKEFLRGSDWRVLRGGTCSGKLIGGYLRNFALMLGSRYFSYDRNEKHLLFLEDYESFNNVAAVNSYISYIEQSDFIDTVSGLIFGHYAKEAPADLLARLERFGAKHGVPVVYTDDFGHGNSHGIFPIGTHGELNADDTTLKFL